MRSITWIIGFVLIVVSISCDNDFNQYQTFINGNWNGVETINGKPDTLSVLNYNFNESGRALLVICKTNATKASGVDTISINTGTYSLYGSKLIAKTSYSVSGNIRESMLEATVLFLKSDSMVLETIDGFKRTRISTFKKIY